jgi:hypothetical protein
MDRRSLVPLPFLLMLLIGCSEAPKTDTTRAPEKPAAPVTGRQAFQSMYPSARGWAVDAQPLQLRSINLQELNSDKGKAGAWQAVFVSQQFAKARSYSFSVVEAAGNLHQGVFGGPAESWSGPTGQAVPFVIAAIKIDSDEAYAAAVAHSADYIKKFPDRPVSFLLEQTNRFPDLAWRVIWGESVSASDYSVFVDASTGKYLETAH